MRKLIQRQEELDFDIFKRALCRNLNCYWELIPCKEYSHFDAVLLYLDKDMKTFKEIYLEFKARSCGVDEYSEGLMKVEKVNFLREFVNQGKNVVFVTLYPASDVFVFHKWKEVEKSRKDYEKVKHIEYDENSYKEDTLYSHIPLDFWRRRPLCISFDSFCKFKEIIDEKNK